MPVQLQNRQQLEHKLCEDYFLAGSAFLASLLVASAAFFSAGLAAGAAGAAAAGLASTFFSSFFAGSAAKADTANNVATRVTIDFI